MSQSEKTLSQSIEDLVQESVELGSYVTVRNASKKLGVKQTEIKDNLPEGTILIAATNGTLSEAKIAFKEKVSKKEDDSMSDEVNDVKVEDAPADGTESEVVETTAEEESEPRTICIICGNPVRKTTETMRGVCPLCFRELSKNSGLSHKALMALTDEEFDVVVGAELDRRRSLEEYKESRILTPEEFEERKDGLLPVKEVFAAGKEAGFGPGRLARAMGGDRFRHEPEGGFGSVWTPFFVGGRKSWYFDKEILNHFEDLRKPVKEKKEKASKGEAVGRDGARGAEMKVVKKGKSETPAAE